MEALMESRSDFWEVIERAVSSPETFGREKRIRKNSNHASGYARGELERFILGGKESAWRIMRTELPLEVERGEMEALK
jgi:hypothetical protein